MLTKEQFTILTEIACEEKNKWQNCYGDGPHETKNRVLVRLKQDGFIDKNGITAKGIDALEPFRVQRAVIFAAGFGERLAPVMHKTPKPLIRICGVRIIDTLLDAIIAAGITEIHIVRGYLAEQFEALAEKYPSIHFIENPLFYAGNNISSAWFAREFLHNAYICDADLWIKNPKIIAKYQYFSNYIGIPVEITDDWCLITKNGYISEMVEGGKHCYLMFGISYWTEEDGVRLQSDIEKVYHSFGGRDYYWDQVALERCKNNYKIGVRSFSFDDIAEIDTFTDLCMLDPNYLEKAE